MTVSNYEGDALLYAMIDKPGGAFGQFASPAPMWGAFIGDQPLVTDTGATIDEADYAGYARLQFTQADFGNPENKAVATVVEKAFAQATGGSFHAKRIAFCDAQTVGAGNLRFWGLLSPTPLVPFTFITQGDYFASGGHGLANDTPVYFSGTELPTPINANTLYYIVQATSDTFKVSLSEGGAPVSVTSDGKGFLGRDGSLQISNNITPTIAAGNLQIVVE